MNTDGSCSWGIGVMLGVYVAGCAGGRKFPFSFVFAASQKPAHHVAGKTTAAQKPAHPNPSIPGLTHFIHPTDLNPAITFVNCLFRKFPWWKFPIYACAQVAGCFCGAAVIYGNYKSAIDVYEGGSHLRTVPGYSDTATAGVFCTYPQPFLTKTGQFFSEIVSSTVLVFVIFAVKDDANLGAGKMVALGLLFLFFGIGATLGWETGYAINLARDFGPRLFTYFVGYGNEVWSAGGYYFWVCLFAALWLRV